MNRLKRVVLITALFSGVMHVDNAFGLDRDSMNILIQKANSETFPISIYPPEMKKLQGEAKRNTGELIPQGNAYAKRNHSSISYMFDGNYFKRVEDAFSYCEACRWSVDDFLNAIEYTNGKSNLFTDNGLFYADNVDALLVDACKNAFSKFIEGLGIPEENSLYSLLTHLKNDHETKLNKHEYSECTKDLKMFEWLKQLSESIDGLDKLNNPQYGAISPDTVKAFIDGKFRNPSEFFRMPEDEFKSDWEDFVKNAFTYASLDVAIENFRKLKTWVTFLKQYEPSVHNELDSLASEASEMRSMRRKQQYSVYEGISNLMLKMTIIKENIRSIEFVRMFSDIAEKTLNEQEKVLRSKCGCLYPEDTTGDIIGGIMACDPLSQANNSASETVSEADDNNPNQTPRELMPENPRDHHEEAISYEDSDDELDKVSSKIVKEEEQC